MADPVQTLTYLRPSALVDGELTLQTAGGVTEAGPRAHPRFFSGLLTRPEPAATGLLAVADVARARYFTPMTAATLAAIHDPVVTAAGDRLRFESFSGCCGVYARLDVLGDGLDGDLAGYGTTNVDVNPPLRQALARVGGGDPLHLSVGADELVVTTVDGATVEKKVPLPKRWLRGFAEVHVITARFDPRAELAAADAAAFLHRLPRSVRGDVLWAVPAGRSLRLTSRPTPGAVCLPGPGRLVALRQLLRFARGLRVYGPVVTAASRAQASCWELDLGPMRLTLTLSPEPARGLSGEGAALSALAADDVEADAETVAGLLGWQPTIDVDRVATAAGLTAARVRAALARLGTAGRVGYDVAEAAYFHRELPYDAAAADRDNPRLVAARALVGAGAVRFGGELHGAIAEVESGGHIHRVRDSGGALSCTCLWWAKHRGDRGPCKHALAVEIARRGS